MARRQKKKPPEDNELRWLTTYGDVVTLLMAFFVMLYAISQVDVQKFQLFVSGLADPFDNSSATQGILTEGSGIIGQSAGTERMGQNRLYGIGVLDDLPDTIDPDPDSTQLAEETAPTTTTLAPGQIPTITTEGDVEGVAEDIYEALRDAGIEDIVDIDLDERGLAIAIATDDVLFASGSARFGAEGEAIVAALAPIIAGFTNRVLVEGHTDSVPLNRGGYDNWNLSTDRALAVLKLLASLGIDPERLGATGYGEHQPRSDNETAEGRADNRRVELVIVIDQETADNGIG